MEIKAEEQYRHYKGKTYTVRAIAFHHESLQKLVVYQANYDDEKLGKRPVFVRPYDMFCEEVEADGAIVKRFTKLEA